MKARQVMPQGKIDLDLSSVADALNVNKGDLKIFMAKGRAFICLIVAYRGVDILCTRRAGLGVESVIAIDCGVCVKNKFGDLDGTWRIRRDYASVIRDLQSRDFV